MSSRLTWPTEQVPVQTGLRRETLSQKNKEKQKMNFVIRKQKDIQNTDVSQMSPAKPPGCGEYH